MKKQLLTPFLTILLLMISCQKDPTPSPDPDQGGDNSTPPVSVATQQGKVRLPDGVSYDLSGHQVWSNGLVEPVNASGDTKIPQITEGFNIAFVFDEDNNPVLAGFMTKDMNEISVESTAKVLLYYSTGVVLMSDAVANIFVNQIDALQEFQEWSDKFTELWKSNPNIMNAPEEIQAAISSTTAKIMGEHKPLDIRGETTTGKTNSRISSIMVDETDLKSGLQVFSEASGQVKINNQYRRRAHGFLYKSKYKASGADNYTEILQQIGSNTAADEDLTVGPTEGITSVFGSLIKQVKGDGMEMAVKEAGPLSLQLSEDEDVAVYWLRIVGPGNQSNSMIKSDAERQKANRLALETFALDFLIPLIGTATGGLKDHSVSHLEGTQKDRAEGLITAVEVFLDAFPNIYDAVKEGDFKAASFAAMDAMMSEAGSDAAETLVKSIASSYLNVSPGESLESVGKKVGKVLFVADALLQTADWGRIVGHFVSSKSLEQWEVKAVASQVKLLPKEATITNASQQKLTASTVDIDESQKKDLKFKWSTEGKYGYLIESTNNRGPSIETNTNEIFYNASTSSSNLSDDENLETIVVEAFLGDDLIGSDTMTVNVKKSLYEIKPDGITLTGKEEGDNPNKVKLHIEPAGDNGSPLGSNPDSDYKIVWTTPGSHGGLMEGESGQTMTTITTYDNGSIWYKATDDQTKESVENINARIYSKPKGATDDEYRLFEDLKATVKINNDEKKKIIHVSMDSQTYSLTQGTIKMCGHYNFFRIEKDPDAESYAITFYDTQSAGYPLPKNTTWKADAQLPLLPNSFQRAEFFLYDDGDSFYYSYLNFGGSGHPDYLDCGRLQSSFMSGRAEVIITLK